MTIKSEPTTRGHPASARRGSVLRPLKDRLKLDSVMDAVSSVELTKTAAWSDLSSLSSNIHVAGIEAVPEGIFETDTGFAAAATIYVDLTYGDEKDSFSSSDSFPAQVQGYFADDGRAIVDSVSVDIASFYG